MLGSMLGVAIFVTLHYLPGTNGSLSLTQISKNNNSGVGNGFGSSNLSYSPGILHYPQDIYAVPAAAIGDTTVALTVASGQIVHGDE